jgi:hypothetical protein
MSYFKRLAELLLNTFAHVAISAQLSAREYSPDICEHPIIQIRNVGRNAVAVFLDPLLHAPP